MRHEVEGKPTTEAGETPDIREKEGRQDGASAYLRRKMGSGFSLFLVLIAAITFYFLLYHLGGFSDALRDFLGNLKAVFYGFAFAYLLNPIMKWADEKVYVRLSPKLPAPKRKSLARGIGIAFALLIFLLIIVCLINMILPQLYQTLRRLIIILPNQINDLIDWVSGLDAASTLGKYSKALISQAGERLQAWIKTDSMSSLNNVVDAVSVSLINTVSTVFNIIVGLVISVYILSGKEKFAGQAKKVLYAFCKRERANYILGVCRKSNTIFIRFIIGKLIDALVVGVLCYLGMLIFNISDRYALLISIFVAVTNIIPFFGPYIGAIPSAFLILLEDPLHCLYFLIFILVLQQIDGNIIEPKILGDSMGLSAFWVVFAILAFGGMFGFIGLILGVPTFAVIYFLMKSYVDARLKRRDLSVATENYVTLANITEDGQFEAIAEPEDAQGRLKKKGKGLLHKIQKK